MSESESAVFACLYLWIKQICVTVTLVSTTVSLLPVKTNRISCVSVTPVHQRCVLFIPCLWEPEREIQQF